MKLHFRKKTVQLLIVIAMFQPAYPLIVWDGKIVPQWPDQYFAAQKMPGAKPFLRKTVAAGFGFYAHPSGTIYGLTMLVDFSDQVANFTIAQVTDWLNKPGYTSTSANGSVHDYYYDVSNGLLDLENDVYGYYRAKHPKSWYEGMPGYSGSDSLVNEVMSYFDPTVNFSKYDNDKNGTTEAINICYAGSGQTYAQGLWPHSGWIGGKHDNVTVGSYNMSDMGTSLSLYVFCHENGHMLFGWPDLYWFGDYCLMGNRPNDVNPPAINDFFRADQGWILTTDITASTNALYKTWHNNGGFRFVNPSKAQEMFYWSKIKNAGRWSNLKGSGILLYHFDYSLGGNTSATHRCLYVVEADNSNAMAAAQWPSPGSRATDFYYSPNKTEFSSTTAPTSLWGLRIYNISAIADSMTFSVGTGVIATIPRLSPVMEKDNTGPVLLYAVDGTKAGFLTINDKPAGANGRQLTKGFYIAKSKNQGMRIINVQ
jgi:M6 family metalloprotease-like protein